jgi:hypothetical protein
MIPYDYNMFVNHVKILIIIISQIGGFQGDDHKHVRNSYFNKQSFSMEDEKNKRWAIF